MACTITLNDLLAPGISLTGTWRSKQCGTIGVNCLTDDITYPDPTETPVITGNPGDPDIPQNNTQQVDLASFDPGIYTFSYELGDFCDGCGDCAEYSIWLGPGPYDSCVLSFEACSRESCDPDEYINLYDWIDCGQTDNSQGSCIEGSNCGNSCLQFGEPSPEPNWKDCFMRKAFVDQLWAPRVIDGNNVQGFLEIPVGVAPNNRTFEYEVYIEVPVGVSWNPATGVIDPCQSSAGNPHTITVTVTLHDPFMLNEDGVAGPPKTPDPCAECQTVFTMDLTITDAENAGTQGVIPSACN